MNGIGAVLAKFAAISGLAPRPRVYSKSTSRVGKSDKRFIPPLDLEVREHLSDEIKGVFAIETGRTATRQHIRQFRVIVPARGRDGYEAAWLQNAPNLRQHDGRIAEKIKHAERRRGAQGVAVKWQTSRIRPRDVCVDSRARRQFGGEIDTNRLDALGLEQGREPSIPTPHVQGKADAFGMEAPCDVRVLRFSQGMTLQELALAPKSRDTRR